MAGELQRTFGQNLRSCRKERGFTQETLAEALGNNPTYIGGIERGERNPSLKVVQRLAAAIDVEPWRLFTPRVEGGDEGE